MEQNFHDSKTNSVFVCAMHGPYIASRNTLLGVHIFENSTGDITMKDLSYWTEEETKAWKLHGTHFAMSCAMLFRLTPCRPKPRALQVEASDLSLWCVLCVHLHLHLCKDRREVHLRSEGRLVPVFGRVCNDILIQSYNGSGRFAVKHMEKMEVLLVDFCVWNRFEVFAQFYLCCY